MELSIDFPGIRIITTGLKHAKEKSKWYLNHVSTNNKFELYTLSSTSVSVQLRKGGH